MIYAFLIFAWDESTYGARNLLSAHASWESVVAAFRSYRHVGDNLGMYAHRRHEAVLEPPEAPPIVGNDDPEWAAWCNVDGCGMSILRVPLEERLDWEPVE